ncbi:MAG: hypothetical protein LBC74_04050, partial [Planctomycetaceae bacterium]|nr:hypothetical protein [Planctomycetaceae bacterium]
YTGKLTDKSSDLQWNINRWYDSDIGRWVSEDPIGFDGDDRNLFRYIKNFLQSIDPIGLANVTPQFNSLGCTAAPCKAKCRADFPESIINVGLIIDIEVDTNAIRRSQCIDECDNTLNGVDLTTLNPANITTIIQHLPQGFEKWYKDNQNLAWTNTLPDCPCKLVKNGKNGRYLPMLRIKIGRHLVESCVDTMLERRFALDQNTKKQFLQLLVI